MGEIKITKILNLTYDQWETMKKALDFYETSAKEFDYALGHQIGDEMLLPIYEQMPDDVF